MNFVAQVGNLLYRRLAVGSPDDLWSSCGLPIRDTADCQSALPESADLRPHCEILESLWLPCTDPLTVRAGRGCCEMGPIEVLARFFHELRSAGWQPAVSPTGSRKPGRPVEQLRITNPRYSRLSVCATG